MAIGVIAQLTAQLLHPLGNIRILFHALPQHEKRSLGIVLLQAIQQFIRVLSRTVIERQCHHRAAGFRIQHPIVVELVILAVHCHPASLYVSIFIKIICLSIDLLHPIGIIRPVGILVPFAIVILLPANGMHAGLSAVSLTAYWLPDCLPRSRLLSLSLDFHSLPAAFSPYLSDNRGDHPSHQKDQKQNDRNSTRSQSRHFADKKLPLLTSHPLT